MSKGITTERIGVLLRALFQVLLNNPDGIRARDAIAQVEDNVELTQHEAGEYETGGKRFDKVLRFATVGAVKAGWMTKNKGIWHITDAGSDALSEFVDPETFYREIGRLYRKWKDAQPQDDDLEESAANVEASITLEEAEEQAWAEIGNYLENIDPYDLQGLVAALLEAMGYHVDWISPPGKDAGLDIVAFTDPLGTELPRIKVQVKRRKDNIGVEEFRSFLALVNDDDVGIYVTTGGYSKDAMDLARHQERRRVMLIDRQRLVELWIEYQDKVAPDKRSSLPLKPIYFLAPDD